MEVENTNASILGEEEEDVVDPILDIIDYLIRCANISFKNSHVDEAQVKTADKIQMAFNLYTKSPTQFLIQFGKYLSPNHLPFFENLNRDDDFTNTAFNECIKYLKVYHSDKSKHKRIRNRRYRALQQMKQKTDYFSEKRMMFRNPLLYEQLVGQYLDDEEILIRDTDDRKDVTFLNVILSTVDMNEMKETKHRQMLEENLESVKEINQVDCSKESKITKKMWGDFDEPDPIPTPKFETRIKATISSNEKALLREEFCQEMYSSFLEGRDEDIDYNSIDNDEQYDDLQQISQDAEDKYFDSELNDINNLEEHMKLVEEYGKKILDHSNDPLDIFMKHIDNKMM